jgi:hypothetical protein
MIAFTNGTTYQTRSIVDSSSYFSLTVVSRTDKTIKTSCGKTLRIKVREGAEFVMPFGVYSMAPTISADRVAVQS